MAIIAGVTVYELRESFAEGLSEQGPSATKAWYVPRWSDRYTVANALLTGSSVTGGVHGAVAFQRPAAYPESANMWANNLTIRGVGRISQGPKQIAWDSAIVTCNYGIPPYQNGGATLDPLQNFDPATPLIYATQKITRGSMFIDLKPGTCKLNDTGSHSLQQGFAMPVGVNTLNLTLHRLPYLPYAAQRATVGSVNSALIFGAAVGTLRWDGMETEQINNPDGSYAQDVHHVFVERPSAAWDKILHPDGVSGWTQVLYNGTSILPSFDFNGLIPSAYGGTG
jgi:hypothetical protein